MSLNPKTSILSRNAAINAVTALLNSGYCDILDGSQASDSDTAISTQNVLAHPTFGATAFAAASGASASANTITDDTDATATGTATWFRCYRSDHTTSVFDGSVGTSSANLVLNSVAIQQHARVSITSFTCTMGA